MKLFKAINVGSYELDEGIILSFRNGNREAMSFIFDRYKGQLMNFVYNMTRNHGIAEDLTHDIFLKAFRYRESFQGNPSQFKSWLWSIARNHTIDYFRKSKEDSLDAFEHNAPGSSELFLIDNHSQGVEDSLIEKSQKESIQNALNSIHPKQKEALSLRIFSELSYEEISKIMNESVPQIKTLIHRAKKSILEHLSKDER